MMNKKILIATSFVIAFNVNAAENFTTSSGKTMDFSEVSDLKKTTPKESQLWDSEYGKETVNDEANASSSEETITLNDLLKTPEQKYHFCNDMSMVAMMAGRNFTLKKSKDDSYNEIVLTADVLGFHKMIDGAAIYGIIDSIHQTEAPGWFAAGHYFKTCEKIQFEEKGEEKK